jgi:tetratricopeptide (TPR) repeat protein
MTRKTLLVLVALLLLFLAGCAATVLRDDPRPVAEIVIQAEALRAAGDYATAAHLYAGLASREPTVGQHYLRCGEMLEALGDDGAARKIYRQAILTVPRFSAVHLELMHRYSLLDAKNRFELETAERLVHAMTKGTMEQYDTVAFLLYQSGQYEKALEFLEKAMARSYTDDQKALVLYHMALIHAGLKDRANTYGAIYYALRNAEHRGVLHDLELLWRELNDPAIADSERWPNAAQLCVEAEDAVRGKAKMVTLGY